MESIYLMDGLVSKNIAGFLILIIYFFVALALLLCLRGTARY